MKIPYVVAILALALELPAIPQAVKDREAAVRKDKELMESDARWLYNDVDKGFAEAKRTGKPLLVVLRCVPCLACAGIDAQVLLEPALQPLFDQFVCLRVINANALDLNLFQFDYDLSFSTIFFNADGTVYGRYGSWTHQKNSLDRTTTGFQRALETTLAIHRGYPANRAALTDKQGAPMPFKLPVEIPTLAGKYKTELDWSGKVVPSCVHCHQIGDALRVTYRERNQALPGDLIYPWPAPETIGLTLAPDSIARIEAVAAGSIAAKAGLRVGDELLALAGQPLVSIADVSWVLHRAPESGLLPGVMQRSGIKQPLNLMLPAAWRNKSDISRRVGTWTMRGMATGGLVLEDLADEARAGRGLKKDQLALLVKGVGQYGKHAAGKNAGFQKDDVIIEMAGLSNRLTEGELIGHLLQKHRINEKVKVMVLRSAQRLELTLPMQ